MARSNVISLPHRAPPVKREPLIPSAVLGMIFFVITEVMFFAGLISAYMIAEGLIDGGWPPPGQPRLPVESTAINTGALLLSGVLLAFSNRGFKERRASSKGLVAGALLLGTWFVVAQGMEWVALVHEGLTLTYSTHGSFFYLIVGTHGVHAVAAILGLGYCFVRYMKGTLTGAQFATAQVFWYFVVGIWPALYNLVYL
jgi:heme/copper-type cytochrome/quinol oxidase subunit 3